MLSASRATAIAGEMERFMLSSLSVARLPGHRRAGRQAAVGALDVPGADGEPVVGADVAVLGHSDHDRRAHGHEAMVKGPQVGEVPPHGETLPPAAAAAAHVEAGARGRAGDVEVAEDHAAGVTVIAVGDAGHDAGRAAVGRARPAGAAILL